MPQNGPTIAHFRDPVQWCGNGGKWAQNTIELNQQQHIKHTQSQHIPGFPKRAKGAFKSFIIFFSIITPKSPFAFKGSEVVVMAVCVVVVVVVVVV
jgi:hypothetical protein